MKKSILNIGIIVIIFLATVTYNLYVQNRELNKEVSTLVSNSRAAALENSNLNKENRVYKLTVSQLSYFNDSIIDKLKEVKNELKIKDKRLKQLQYLKSEITKPDSIVFSDTIFSNPSFKIDTLLGDKWFNIKLGLDYPSKISITPSITSEKFIIVSIKKETIKPPHKWWLFRLFQKKHKVAKVDVIEKNPYVNNKQERFIEIIK